MNKLLSTIIYGIVNDLKQNKSFKDVYNTAIRQKNK